MLHILYVSKIYNKLCVFRRDLPSNNRWICIKHFICHGSPFFIHPSIHTHTYIFPNLSSLSLETTNTVVCIQFRYWELFQIQQSRQMPQDTNLHNQYSLKVTDTEIQTAFLSLSAMSQILQKVPHGPLNFYLLEWLHFWRTLMKRSKSACSSDT